MAEYPRTVLEFRDWFADDAACRDYLAKLRWPEGFRCPICSEPDQGENLLPLANRVASLLKRWLLGTHQGAVSATHLDYYLDEYTFRFNRRTSGSRGLLFLRLMQQAVDLSPVPAKELLGGRRFRESPTN